jgi:hypothetical protein
MGWLLQHPFFTGEYMTKIILTNGKEEFCSAGRAREKVSAGEATWPHTPLYTTRQMVADVPEKKVRKKKAKAEEEQADSDEAE